MGMYDKAEQKKALRREMLRIRNQMDTETWHEKSERIRENFWKCAVPAEQILCYAGYGREVDTLGILKDCLEQGREVYCPLVSGRDMEFYRIFSVKELQSGFHGIWEPPEREAERYVPKEHGHISRMGLMVMPGVVFDRSRHRIGYGGGYYDRYLQRVPGMPVLALAFGFQIREEIPYEEHDICPHMILTEDGEI